MAVLWAAEDLTWLWTLLGVLSIPALVSLNAFFVAAEFALVAVRKTKVIELVGRGIKGAKAVQIAIDHLDRSIAATQLGITLASIGLGWVSERSLANVLYDFFGGLPAPWDIVATHSVAITVAFLIVTFMHVVFGELMPKSLALQTPDRIALWVAGPLNVFAKITRPLIVVMNGTGNALIRLAGYKASEESLVHSVEELSLLIEGTEEAGILASEQAEVVRNVFRMHDTEVRECMVPREKMAVLDLNSPPDKILDAVRQGAHTRMPVYDGELDKVVGIVNTKDLFYLFSLKGVVILEDALYPALFLKPDESVANALRLFQKAKRHMALVRDDDGKIHGVVTLEDILEQIIGDIEDEHDRPSKKLKLRRTSKLRSGKPEVRKPPT